MLHLFSPDINFLRHQKLTIHLWHRCLTCRKRKTRCDGEKPTCSTCEKNGHQCLGYPDYPEKPKNETATSPLKFEIGERVKHESPIDVEDQQMEDTDGHETDRDHVKGPIASRQLHLPADLSPPRPSRSDSISTTGGNTALRQTKEHEDWGRESSQSHTPGKSTKRYSTQRTVSFSEDGRSQSNRSPVQLHHDTHRVPYFRYFGPTAIVPGFKQMVVNVQHYNRRRSRGSVSATSPLSLLSHHSGPSHAETVLEPLDDMPIYDPNDPAPVHPIIVNLIKTFFRHLGSTYPFLREEKTLRLVKEKRLESILVDAICALAARFSDSETLPGAANSPRSEYGAVFAQRAKTATVDLFPCPTVGAVQAYLLLAYEGFGENQDSTLWMYLGLAIRMMNDLGLQRNEGVQYQGDKDPWYTRSWNRAGVDEEHESSPVAADEETLNPTEQQEIVQERIDTAWSVYILDRFISSGTGRTVTVKDEDFELPTPETILDPSSGCAAPYPAFIQIIQFYGRVSDVLNKLKKVSDLTDQKLAALAEIERDLMKLYHKQDPSLHFNPLHFQNYVKIGQGTLFILLHVWFHALMIILHQPLLTAFGSRHPQLNSHSHELAMSSAKTIADILALAELIDPNSYIGSPFTSQPMYIAACAFLRETAANTSQPVSRATTPPGSKQNGENAASSAHGRSNASGDKSSKHSLLAEAASQNYQRCYKSLQQLNTYWHGVNYILVALDHRSKGIWDCETYTAEEYESTKLPRRPDSLANFPRLDNPSSPQANVPPIAWSLTGTTNSPNSSLTLLYQNMNASSSQSNQASTHPPPAAAAPVSTPTPPGNMIYDPIRQSLGTPTDNISTFSPTCSQSNVSAVRYSAIPSNAHRLGAMRHVTVGSRTAIKFDPSASSENGPGTPGSENRLQPYLGMTGSNSVLPPLNSQPYTPSSTYEPSILQGASPSSTLTEANTSQQRTSALNSATGATPTEMVGSYGHDFAQSGLASGANYYFGNGPIADAITVEEINLNSLGLSSDMMPPWDFFPADFSGLFDANNLGDPGHHGQM